MTASDRLHEDTTAASPEDEGLPRRLSCVTGVRWWAAVIVFVVHVLPGYMLSYPAEYVPGPLATFLDGLGYGVQSMFFVLSGFVLFWSSRPADTMRGFWRRRLARIYPTHLLTTLLVLGLLVAGGIGVPWSVLVPNLLLIHTWTPDYDVVFGLNGVTWSLGCEAFFYLLFPLLLIPIRRIRPSRLWAWSAGVAALVLVLPLLAVLVPAGPELPFVAAPATRWWFIGMLPPMRLPEFVLGILLARALSCGYRIPVRPWFAWAAFIAVSPLAAVVPSLFKIAAVAVIPSALLVVAAAQSDVAGRKGMNGRPWMVWLGQVSFPMYLLHGLVLVPVGLVFGQLVGWTPLSAAAAVIIGFVLTVAVSGAVHTWFERPLYRRLAVSRHDRREVRA